MGSKNSGTRGKTNNPHGRPKGSGNKSTELVRKAVADLLDGYAPRMHEWLDQVAADNPAKALDVIVGLLEYSLPKLQRTEVQNLDENGEKAAAVQKIEIVHVEPK